MAAVALALPLLGGSMLMGSGAANASTCPAGQHWNEMGGGSGFCSPDASGGGTGGNGSVDLGGGTSTSAPVAPIFTNPNPYTPPVYAPYVPPQPPVIAQPAPAPAPRSITVPAAPVAVAPVQGNAGPVANTPDVSAPKADQPEFPAPAAEPTKPSGSGATSVTLTVVAPTDQPSVSASPSPSESASPVEMKFGQASSAGKIDSRSVGAVIWLGIGIVVVAGAYMSLRIAAKRKASKG